MSDPLERYLNLALEDSMAKSYRYPLACKELSFIIRGAFNYLPKNLQSLIYQHTITAFHLLPQMQTSAAVSAAHLLAQGVEAALPKQKRNSAIVEFRKAMVAHKRRSKALQEGIGCGAQLPQDVLLHIFRFLDIESFVSARLVCRSWNVAADDEYLWQLQYTTFFGCSDNLSKFINYRGNVDDLARISMPGVDWKEAFKRAYIGNSLRRNTYGRGYCQHCDTIVFFSSLKCPNDHGRNKRKQIKPLLFNQIVDYVLNGSLYLIYCSDSDTDSDEDAISEFWALPKYFSRRTRALDS